MAENSGWFGDHIRHKKAGKKGGMSTYKKLGYDFFKKIGSIGGKKHKKVKPKLI